METQLTMDSTVPTSKTTEFIYPDDTPHIVRKNAEILFQEMDTIKEAALFSARKLESVGIKEIKDIHIEIVRGGFYHATIVDSDGEQYYISLGEYGYIGGIRKDDIDGEIVWLPIF